MKKITLSFALMMASAMAWADHWTSATAYDYPTNTPVYVALDINGSAATSSTTVEVAAFVNGTCRATATTLTKSQNTENSFYYLNVLGEDADEGSDISFRVYYNGLEYAVQPTATVSYDGNPHAGVKLSLEAITGIYVDPTINIVEDLPYDYSLTNFVKYEYEDGYGYEISVLGTSTLLSAFTYEWNTNGSYSYEVDGDVLKVTGECENGTLGITLKGPDYGDGHQFVATASTIVNASFPVSFYYPTTINMNRYGVTTVSLSDVIGNFDPSLVEFSFPKFAGIPVAVTSYYQNSGVYYYNVYANTIGSFDYEVYYNGEKMLTESSEESGTINISSSMTIPSGWSWKSLYSTNNADGRISLLDGTDYYSWVSSNISEVRSQFSNFYNDKTYGIFGDITELNSADGMYKINATAATSVTLGTYTSGGFAQAKAIHKGYNWFNNPYQYDIPLSQLTVALGNAPAAGDKLIGKDGFAEYNGTEWESSSDFLLESGKGYMYYSSGDAASSLTFNEYITYVVSSSVNSKVLSVAPTSAAVRRVAAVNKPLWNYDTTAYPDNMAIVAAVDGILDIDDYSIGAFVGDECRGEGKVTKSGKMFINVAGKSGDKVSFKLLNKNTGEVTDMNETIRYAQNVGCLEAPVRLSTNAAATAITAVDASSANVAAIHDASGRTVSNMSHGVYFVTYNQDGTTVTKKVIK